jgi:hypothetical protein
MVGAAGASKFISGGRIVPIHQRHKPMPSNPPDPDPIPAPAPSSGELPILEATLDLIRWFLPVLHRLPRQHRHGLGDRLIANLYELLEQLALASFQRNRLPVLEPLAGRLHLIQLQTRLLHDLQLIDLRRGLKRLRRQHKRVAAGVRPAERARANLQSWNAHLAHGHTWRLRGGSWTNNPRNCRSACRNHNRPDNVNNNVGFRLVCLP